jgi:hypothetical protein
MTFTNAEDALDEAQFRAHSERKSMAIYKGKWDVIRVGPYHSLKNKDRVLAVLSPKRC